MNFFTEVVADGESDGSTFFVQTSPRRRTASSSDIRAIMGLPEEHTSYIYVCVCVDKSSGYEPSSMTMSANQEE